VVVADRLVTRIQESDSQTDCILLIVTEYMQQSMLKVLQYFLHSVIQQNDCLHVGPNFFDGCRYSRKSCWVSCHPC